VARYTGPVDRLCRREGKDLQLKGERYYKGKTPWTKRPVPPGMHIQQRIKLTPYAIQLREKQSLKRIYGVFERQFILYFKKADRMRGITGEIMLQLLERRLDNVVYRAGFASTRAQARQLVNHGHVRVNGRKVDIASFQVRPNDEITLNDKLGTGKTVSEALVLTEKQGRRKGWIEFSAEPLAAVFRKIPGRQEINDIEIKEQLIVELYSR